jgi:hypothetical protein
VDDADRYRLLGKYRTPRVRVGRVVRCEIRGEVKGAGFTTGLIPWPKCKTGSWYAIILAGDLAGAVRHESQQDVAHWWCVCIETVWKWRKALGVGPSTPGTFRLRSDCTKEPWAAEPLAAAQAKADDPERREKIAAVGLSSGSVLPPQPQSSCVATSILWTAFPHSGRLNVAATVEDRTMRKLLALVVLLSLAEVGRADDEAIVKRLKEMGATVEQSPGSRAELYVQLDANNLDTALAELCELRGLRGVSLSHPNLTDHQLRRICALPGVESLDFNDCSITNVQLRIVAGVRGLEVLSLRETAITDAGLPELTGMRNLNWLILGSGSITDSGLRHLEGMRGLIAVDLSNCPKITDAGLRHLEGLRGLARLELTGCPKITDAGVARLKKALPKCKITR